MAWLARGLAMLLAVVVAINGGYWESHHHVWAGVFMALLGIVSLVIISGASAAHVEHEEIRLE